MDSSSIAPRAGGAGLSRVRHALQRDDRGEPYFAFLPLRLSLVELGPWITPFLELDRIIASDSGSMKEEGCENGFDELEADIQGGGNCGKGSIYGRLSSLLNVLGRKPVSIKTLRRANAMAVGEPVSVFRSNSMLVGSHRADHASFVAPPAQCVASLMSDLITFIEKRDDLPVTLRAAVAVGQFLLIHPFRDGNGRTARAMFIGFCGRNLGFSPALLNMVRVLWEHRGLQLHAATMHVRESDSWAEFISVVHKAFLNGLDHYAP